MKKVFSRIVGFSCVILLMLSGVAFSAEGPYVSGNLGIGFLTDIDIPSATGSATIEFDPGLALGVALGYGFGKTRIEGEIAYQKNDIGRIGARGVSFNASGDITSTSFLWNGYLDFVNNGPLTPYISVGIGFAKLEVNDFAIMGVVVEDVDDTVLAYQVGAGFGYAINKNLTIDLKYRYFATEDPKFKSIDAEFASHNLLFGVRVNF